MDEDIIAIVREMHEEAENIRENGISLSPDKTATLLEVYAERVELSIRHEIESARDRGWRQGYEQGLDRAIKQVEYGE